MLKRLFKSENFLSFLGNGIFAVLGFLGIYILARSFPKEVFGEWVLYITGFAFMEMLRSGISGTPMVRFLSGATSQEEGKNIIGSGWVIGLIITLIIALILYIVYFLISKKLDESGFKLFFLWYPILSFIMMPYNYSICYLQAFRKFGPMIFLRIINMGSFVIFLIISYLFLSVEIWVVVIVHLACNGLASLSGIILGWSGLDSIRYAKKSWIKEQINFGKFSVGTLIGSNLLKIGRASCRERV